MSGSETAPLYAHLGVERVINAADTYTALGGGRLPDEVREAMSAASAHHVSIPALLDAVGRRIAELTCNPAAAVVAGAAAGLAASAAAVIAGTDPGRIAALPEQPGPRDEFVVLRGQRNPYDRALLSAGGRLVEVGFADSTPLAQLEHAIGDRTAAVVWYAGTRFEREHPPLEDIARAAHDRGVPVIVDAAAQLPPVSNLWSYRERGGDLVVFSGGKGLKGPQSSGLVVGSEELVAAVALNSYPHHSIGRAMKTSKESIMGLLAAVERAVALDWTAERARWDAALTLIASRVEAVIEASWVVASGRLGQDYPRLFLRLPEGRDPEAVAAALRGHRPAVELGVEPGEPVLVVNPYSLLPGEDTEVADALVAVLGAGS